MTDEPTTARALIDAYRTCARPSAAREAELWAALVAAERAAPRRRPAPSRAPWFALAAGLLLLAAWQLGLPRYLASGHVLQDMRPQAPYEAAPGSSAGVRSRAGGGSEETTGAQGHVLSDITDSTGLIGHVQQDSIKHPGDAPRDSHPPGGATGHVPADSHATPDGANGPAKKGRPTSGKTRGHVPANSHPAPDGASGHVPEGSPPRPAAGATDSPSTAPDDATSREAAPGPSERVLAEMALLQQAQAALRGGRPGEALELLARHAEAFRDGSLIEERQALRVLALCAAGERARGAAEAASFLRAHPRSTYAGRIADACPKAHE